MVISGSDVGKCRGRLGAKEVNSVYGRIWKQESFVCVYVGMYVWKARKFVFVSTMKV
jgi:hypothetical protein